MIILVKLLSILAFVILLITILVRTFKGRTIASIHPQAGSMPFIIAKPGYYSIWVNTQAFRGVPPDIFHPQIRSASGARVRSIPSYLRPHTGTPGGDRSMQLQYGYLPAGSYTFFLQDPDAVAEDVWLARAVGNLKDEPVAFQVRKTLPEFLFPLVLVAGLVPAFMILASLRPG